MLYFVTRNWHIPMLNVVEEPNYQAIPSEPISLYNCVIFHMIFTDLKTQTLI